LSIHKPKLLITGVSGFLGYHLLRIAAERFEVYGISYKNGFDFRNATYIKCDITNYIELGNYFEDIGPDVVIHAAAIADANFCERNKELSYATNVEATKNFAGLCSDYNIPFVFTSTDLVFDGTKSMYREEDEKNPLSTYALHKSIAEDNVLRIYPSALVFRLPVMFGSPLASPSNYLQNFIAQIKSGNTVKLFNDEYRSICGARSIAKGILQLMNQHGVIHLAGKEKLSRYEFGLKAAEAFGLNNQLLLSCSQKDVKLAAPRPADVSLDISKAIYLGFSPLSADEELKLIAHNNYLS
jgi:dTDP-4-dehydrorhamnose reductase